MAKDRTNTEHSLTVNHRPWLLLLPMNEFDRWKIWRQVEQPETSSLGLQWQRSERRLWPQILRKRESRDKIAISHALSMFSGDADTHTNLTFK